MAMIEFLNTSRGRKISYGADAGVPASGKPGSQGYQPAIAPQPIERMLPDGLMIHGVSADATGKMPDGEVARRFESMGLIKVLSRDATGPRTPEQERIAALEEKVAALVAENSALRDRSAGVHSMPPIAGEPKKQQSKQS